MLLVLLNNLAAQIMPNFVPQRDLYEVRERPSKIYKWTSKWPYSFLVSQMNLFSLFFGSSNLRQHHRGSSVEHTGSGHPICYLVLPSGLC